MASKKQSRHRSSHGAPRRPSAVPKLIGADVELGGCIVGLNRLGGTGHITARALLREISGVANPEDCEPDDDGKIEIEPTDLDDQDDRYTTSYDGYASYGGYRSGYGYGYGTRYGGSYGSGYKGSTSVYNPQDWGRKWLQNGGCAYIDLGHLEVCVPETLSAFDHLAAWHAMLRIARMAQQQAQAKLPPGQSLEVLANNSDGQGNSYGSHTNFLVTRRCMNNIVKRKLHHMLFLASHFVSSIVYTGAGKVGSENGRRYNGYQLAQRADFYETTTGVQTTYNRPIVNLRDEALCGRAVWGGSSSAARSALGRVHVIFFDNTLCHVATLLKMGVTQIVLAMIEQEQVDASLILDSPLAALRTWSRDPDCKALATLTDGRKLTAIQLQQMFWDRAKAFVDAGRADDIVPRAAEIVALWGQTLAELCAWDLDALVGKLDHILKRCILEDAISQRGLDWDSDDIRYLDQIYGSLRPSQGLYWLYGKDVVQTLVPDSLVERFVHEPPADTRAYLRGHIVRLVDDASLTSMDWDHVRLRFTEPDDGTGWPSSTNYVLPMANPLALTEAQCGEVLASSQSVPRALEGLGMVESTFSGQPLGDVRGGDTASTVSGGQVVLVRDVSHVGLYGNNTSSIPRNTNTKGGKTE